LSPLIDLGTIASIGDLQLERGTTYRCRVSVGFTASGPATIPVVIMCGASKGPTVGMTAGVHACEYTGQFALKELVRRIDPADLSGELRISPCINSYALDLRHSFYTPIDGKNINELFPGDAFGGFAERVAWVIQNEFIEGNAAYLDLHSGDLFEDVPLHVVAPVTGNVKTDEASEQLAGCFDIPILNIMGVGIDGIEERDEKGRIAWRGLDVMRNNIGSAARSGVPAIQLEVGGGGRLDTSLVAMEVDGLENILCHLGMLEGSSVAYEHSETVFGMYVVASDLGGYFEPAVEPGSRVEKGSMLGRYTDVFGTLLGEVHSPLDGIVLMQFTTPVRNSGEPCCIIGLSKHPEEFT
jgi:predicted deacylase